MNTVFKVSPIIAHFYERINILENKIYNLNIYYERIGDKN